MPNIKKAAVKHASWIKAKILIYIYIRCVLMYINYLKLVIITSRILVAILGAD